MRRRGGSAVSQASVRLRSINCWATARSASATPTDLKTVLSGRGSAGPAAINSPSRAMPSLVMTPRARGSLRQGGAADDVRGSRGGLQIRSRRHGPSPSAEIPNHGVGLVGISPPDENGSIPADGQMAFDEVARQSAGTHHQQHLGRRGRQQVGRQGRHGGGAHQRQRSSVDRYARLPGLSREEHVGGVHRRQSPIGVVRKYRDDLDADVAVRLP